MLIRKCNLSDANNFLSMQLALDKETKYMLLEPEERVNDINRTKAMIEKCLK